MDKKIQFITKELVEKAAQEIEKKGIPKKREGKEYSVVVNGKEFPFKLLITEAAKLSGIELDSKEFGSSDINREGFKEITGYKCEKKENDMDFFTKEEFNAVKNNLGKIQKETNDNDQKLIKSLHKKAIHLATVVNNNISGFKIGNAPNIINPSAKATLMKSYYWYRIYPTKTWSDLDISLTFTITDEFEIKIDSYKWDEELYKRKELLKLRTSEKLEEIISIEKVLSYSNYGDLAEKVISFYNIKIVPFKEKLTSIASTKIGLLASDSTGWQDGHIAKRKGFENSAIWNSKVPTGKAKTYKELKETIKRNGYFELCYIQKGQANFSVKIIEIAKSDKELGNWKNKDKIQYFNNKISSYTDDKKNAKIVFNCSSFKKVTPSIAQEKYKLFESVHYPRQDNLSPFFMRDVENAGLTNNNEGENLDDMNKDSSLNQILFGPPGTGKTYHTINKAIELIGEDHAGKKLSQADIKAMERDKLKAIFDKFVDKGQIVFTTFHQSMSYEDFVEGIKPLEPKKDESPVTYKVVDGIFKKLCYEARRTKKIIIKIDKDEKELTKEFFEELYNAVVEKLPTQDQRESEFELKTPSKYSFWLFKNSANSIVVKAGSKENPMSLSLNELSNIIFENKKPNLPSYSDAVIAKVLENIEYKKVESDNIKKSFVLIIDEINRGNVSAIFGELITLIEKDKRIGGDEELKAVLPYSKDEINKFGVPPNLYIIGTMNTADRSVEALDTALRRRFSFDEMPPKSDIIKKYGKLKNEDDTKAGILEIEGYEVDLGKLLTTINKRLKILLDSDHLIGHSYFMSVNSPNSLKGAFSKQIIPLLQEYFYGDHGKISLVLGEGFCKGEKVNNANEVFAIAKGYETDVFNEKIIYNLRDPEEMKNEELREAIKILLKVQKEEASENSEQDTK